MFFYYIFSAYLIPAVYLYFRISYLLIPKGKKLIFTLLFVLFFTAFPAAEMLAHDESVRYLIPLVKVGFYTMPFMLYLFLLVLVFDVFLLLNLVLKWLPIGFLKAGSFRKWGLITSIVIPSLILMYGIINFNLIRVSEYSVEVPKQSSKLENLSIAFISDFHIGDLTSIKFVERFIKKMESLGPDIILFGGDLLEVDRDDLRMSQIEMFFKELNATYGKIGVFGNHEGHGRQSSHDFYRNTDIFQLHDSTVFIDSSFFLVGRKDARNRSRLYVEALTSDLLNGFPVLMLDHRPTDIDAVSKSKVDIQFSGHTHHGQLFPINFITRDIYEIGWGYKKIGGTHFFVSSGIQLWGPPVRTVGKSEIMLIHVHFIE